MAVFLQCALTISPAVTRCFLVHVFSPAGNELPFEEDGVETVMYTSHLTHLSSAWTTAYPIVMKLGITIPYVIEEIIFWKNTEVSVCSFVHPALSPLHICICLEIRL